MTTATTIPLDQLERGARAIEALPAHWRTPHWIDALFDALIDAYERPEHDAERIASWDKVRCLAGFPEVPGARRPLFSLFTGPSAADPYAGGTPPEFGELLAALNMAAGWVE